MNDKNLVNNRLKKAFREVWLIDKNGGHEMEWERHWNCANSMRKNNPSLYERTVYPELMNKAKLMAVLMEFPDTDFGVITMENHKVLETPKYSDWQIELVKGTRWIVVEGGVRCWFHRKMQELCFGIKWTKVRCNG